MKKVCLCCLLAAIGWGLSAQELSTVLADHTLSLDASIGLLAGRSEEIVYWDKTSKNKLSQLLWDLKPLVYAGLDIQYLWQKPERTWGLFARSSFKFGFPGETGIMEDRDWQSAATNPRWLTDYSVHDNHTDTAFLLDLDVGAAFGIFDRFTIKPFISYNFMLFSWRGVGGAALHYGTNGHGYFPQPIDVIAYRQTWHILSPGLRFYGDLNRYFIAELSFKMSPLVWCMAEDIHYAITEPNKNFYDELDIGLFIEPGLVFSFTPTDLFFLSLSVFYRNIRFIRGDETLKQQGQPTKQFVNAGGAGYSVFDISLAAKFNVSDWWRSRSSKLAARGE
jgi:outer membrane protease